ncbi:MAG: alkaline phosphatase family protein [Candidatus Magasanikbacteria bacterium]
MATVVFGLGGADPELVEKWIEQLPNFQRLMEEGFFGSFNTIEPPITVPAWMCMFSGREPSDFDAYDFRSPDFEDYTVDVTGSSHFRNRNLIDLSENVISFRIPGTTPKYPVDGVMVSGFIEGERLDFEPEEIGEEIDRELDTDLEDMEGTREEKRKIADGNFRKNFDVYRYLLQNRDFDTAFSVFRLIDTHMHNVDSEEELKKAYILADRYLGKMIDLVEDSNYNLLVLSDHGSIQTERKLYLNNLLRKKGFLEYRSREGSLVRKLEERIGSLLVNLGLKKQVKKLLEIYSGITGEDPQHTQSTILPVLEKSETEAFCYISGVSRYGVVWIHDDRFSRGIVEDREEKAEEVIEALEQEEFIEEVSRPGSFTENPEMPDILVKAERGIVVGAEPYNVNFHRTSAVVHDERGLIAGLGPGFRAGERVEAGFQDIAPTIQALGGEVDVSNGRVLDKILSDEVDYGQDLRDLDI